MTGDDRKEEYFLSHLPNSNEDIPQLVGKVNQLTCLLKAVCNNSATLVIYYNEEGIITEFNEVAVQVLGYSVEEVVQINTPALFHLEEELINRANELNVNLKYLPDHKFDFIQAVNAVKISGKEWLYVRKDGSKLHVNITIVSGEFCGLDCGHSVILANDISEKKKPEMELRAALRKEKDLNDLKSRFVSMASHEFRTPLGAVLSSAYLVGKYTREDQQPQREKHLKQIVTSVEALTNILEDFLSVGKIEEGKITPVFTQIDVEQHVLKIANDVHHLLKKYQKINYEHVGNVTTVMLDGSMLKMILTNLLSNAIKYSTDESSIEVYTEIRANELILSVTDHGIGIPEDEQANLFNIFFRSSYSANIQGTGLGLHIVKKYVELLDGNIEFSSEIGEGTIFKIHFRLKNRDDIVLS